MSEKERLFLKPKPHRRIILRMRPGKLDGYISPWGGIAYKHPISIDSTEIIEKSRYINEGIELLIRNETRRERFLRTHYGDNVIKPLPTEYYPKEKVE